MKDNKTKVITIAALVIAVIALSIGFAAFSSTLNIQTGANINPTDNFSVKFSKVDGSLVDNQPVLPTEASTASGDIATINNNDSHNPKISGLSAHFTAPGQKVEYVFYVRNMGPYDAYLTDVRFNNAQGGSSFKKCTATGDNPVSNASAMCEHITFKLELAELATPLTNTSDISTIIGNNYYISKSADPTTGTTNSKQVKVTIEYTGNTYADGSFDINFGDVEMIFATLQGYVPTPPTPQAPDYSSMFVSYEEGVLSEYIGTDTDVVIPDGLMLPVTTQTATYNSQKCINNFPTEMLEEGKTVEASCAELDGLENMLTVSQIILYNVDFAFDITSTVSDEDYLITNIGESAFYQKGIRSLSIGNSIETIEDIAFRDNNISTLDLSNATNLTTIKNGAFQVNNLTSLTIPSSVTTIGDSAFDNNYDLSYVRILNNQGIVTIPGSPFTTGTTVEFNDGTITWGS